MNLAIKEVTKSDNKAALREILELFPALNNEHANDEISAFLFACTPFPILPVAQCLPGIRDLAKRSGGDLKKAYEIVDSDIAESLKRAQQIEVER